MTPALIDLMVDGRAVSAAPGSTVASAVLNAGGIEFRASPTGAMRAPLCGMGVCFECRVTIDGVPHRRACMAIVREGMTIVTAGALE